MASTMLYIVPLCLCVDVFFDHFCWWSDFVIIFSFSLLQFRYLIKRVSICNEIILTVFVPRISILKLLDATLERFLSLFTVTEKIVEKLSILKCDAKNVSAIDKPDTDSPLFFIDFIHHLLFILKLKSHVISHGW